MKIVLIILVLLTFFTGLLSGQQSITVKAGSSKINLELIDYKNDNLLFINLHNNEVTSIKAIKQVLSKSFGKYLGLLSGGTREVNLKENGKTITFDPNRIYTKAGIEKTLKNYNCYSESNFNLTETFSKEFLKYFSKAKLLVALHNNTNGGFSINKIFKEMNTKKDVKEININPEKDEDDFYFVTEKSKFDYFKSKGYNVVLQDNKHVEDDGSLIVYCISKSISYINIECENSHLDEQIQMIQEVYKGFFGMKDSDK
jgi:hypothetical protein